MTDKILVLSTTETAEQARTIARALVEARLAACVSIVPSITSVYTWKGAVEEAGEALLIIKTSRELFEELHSAVERIHPYETPELIALPIADGAERYLEWLSGSLKSQDGAR